MGARIDGLSEVVPDQPDADRVPAPASRAALRERLRNLAPSHASAIPRETPVTGKDQPADREPARRTDEAARNDYRPGWRDFDTLKRRFWDQADHFSSLWAAHQEKWPRPAVRDRARPDDPPGSWRGNGDQYLSPEENLQAGEVIELLQECEPTVTDLLQRLEAESPFGARLVGLEHRRKEPDRLKEKIADALRVEDAADVAEATEGIFDAVRYTFCVGVECFAEGYADMHERLEAAGYRMIFRANRWIDDPEYRGMNTRWLTPEGDRFELQFHTPESFYAKEAVTHKPYERLRNPETSAEERVELEEFQQIVCATVPVPAQISDVPDVRSR